MFHSNTTIFSLSYWLQVKNPIQEEIKSRLKLGNVCYYSVQNLLFSSLLSKKLKIKIYRTIIFPGVHRVLVGKPEGKRPLGRPRRRWEDNIKMDFQEVGGNCGDWMELAQDRDRWRALMGTVRNLRFPKRRGIS